MRITLLIPLMFCLAAAPSTQPSLPIDASATDLAGHARPVIDAKSRGTVLLFIGTDCPVSNGYVPEINRLVQAYTPRGVEFVTVYAGASVTQTAAAKHAVDFSIACDGVLDPACVLAHAVGANVTPEVALLRPDGSLAYRGRIDDKVVGFGKQRTVTHQHDLADAIDVLLAGKSEGLVTTPAIGCTIVESGAK